MRSEIKYGLLAAFSFLCLIGFAAQTVQLWRVNEQLSELSSDREAIPASIEQRLLAELDKKPPHNAWQAGMPFAGFSEIQDYMDSFFTGFAPPAFPGSTPFPRSNISLRGGMPQIALDETEEDYLILIPIDPEQEIELNTNIEDNAVSVSGVISENMQSTQNSFVSSFRSQRQFARTLELPTPIDQFGMSTEQTEEGIRITIPKKTG